MNDWRNHQMNLADDDPLPVIYFAPIVDGGLQFGRLLPERHFFRYEGYTEYQDYYWPVDENG